MKAIDFTHPGGFPLTQDELDYLQQAYTECLGALASMGGGGPTIITGMISSTFLGTTTVSDGWFFHGGEMIKFIAGTYSAIPPGDVPLVSITPTATNLIYNLGSSFGAVLNKTATVVLGPPSTSFLLFPLSVLQPFQLTFGLNGRETGWNSLAVSTPVPDGGVTGTVFYKKNFLTNTLQIRGLLSANNAQNFAASPAALFYDMGSLPANYTPVNVTYFTAHYPIGSMIKDDLGISWLKHFTCGINTGGQLSINWIRPDIAIAGYSVYLNTIIPLD